MEAGRDRNEDSSSPVVAYYDLVIVFVFSFSL